MGIGRVREWPSPNRAAAIVRSTARSFKATGRSLLQRVKRRRDVDAEAGVVGEKTAERAVEEYRQTLQNTFGSSERINDVMLYVRAWIDG